MLIESRTGSCFGPDNNGKDWREPMGRTEGVANEKGSSLNERKDKGSEVVSILSIKSKRSDGETKHLYSSNES